jgi:hypothetical protein
MVKEHIYPHFIGVWILQQYVPNEEKPPCQVSSRPAEPQLRIPPGGSEAEQDLEGAFTLLPHNHILLNTARSRIQTAPGLIVQHN